MPLPRAVADVEQLLPGTSHGSTDVWLEGAGTGPNISASSRIEDCEQNGNKGVREAQHRPASPAQGRSVARELHVRPPRALVLHLAFLHLILFLLFLPTLGSLLQGSLQQGVLPLPSPHLLQGQGTGL